jgi:hypothetical protein
MPAPATAGVERPEWPTAIFESSIILILIQRGCVAVRTFSGIVGIFALLVLVTTDKR